MPESTSDALRLGTQSHDMSVRPVRRAEWREFLAPSCWCVLASASESVCACELAPRRRRWCVDGSAVYSVMLRGRQGILLSLLCSIRRWVAQV